MPSLFALIWISSFEMHFTHAVLRAAAPQLVFPIWPNRAEVRQSIISLNVIKQAILSVQTTFYYIT